jgi:anaerobic magnesium-protoporphyrin IX monomethyl ester cyclase
VSNLVTLIRCPTVLPLGSITAQQGVPSLALAYLASSLEKNNFNVYCIDALGDGLDNYSKIPDSSLVINGLDIFEIIERIPKETKYLGLSCMFSNEWIYTKVIIQKIHTTFPNIKIILGGEHATADSQHILAELPFLTACVLGEGEDAFVKLLEALENNQPLEKVNGISFLNFDHKYIQNERNNRVKDINTIPWPNWDLLPLTKYLDRGLGMAAQGLRSMPMIASRGCPYRCTFCSSENMWTTSWYARDITDLISEIKYYKNKYNIQHLEFYDLTAIINKKWTQEFCRTLIKEELNLTWSLPSGTRSEALCKETLKLLKLSGCSKLTFAPETGSANVLKIIDKRANLSKMLIAMNNSAKEGIVTKANIIFGFPGATWTDFFWDFIFLFKMAIAGVHDVTCFAFVPYPGSKIFNQLLKKKEIIRDDDYQMFLSYNVYNDISKMTSWCSSLRDWHIPLLTLSGMSFFYLIQFLVRPWRILTSVWRILFGKPLTMFELAIENMKNSFIKGNKLNIKSGQFEN